MIPWVLIFVGTSIIALLGYWLLHVTEGAFLGPTVVTLLYDVTASHYDSIKRFTNSDETWFLSRPLLNRLAAVPQPLVLDVATGTGRLPHALFRESVFRGRIIALDLSHRMLEEAVSKTEAHASRILFLQQDATELPFPDATFDAITCLEALEFLPDTRRTLLEMARVLRPGGVLLTTNRRGWEAGLFLWRSFTQPRIVSLLKEIALEEVTVQSWQQIYDLVWARRSGGLQRRGEDGCYSIQDDFPQLPLSALVRCPQCQSATLQSEAVALRCPHCEVIYPVEEHIVELTLPSWGGPTN